MTDERWHGPFFWEKSGSFKNNAKYGIFDSFYFFVKNVEIQMKNGWFFWKALPFSDLPAKFHVQKRSGSFKMEVWLTPIDAFFAIFDHFEWSTAQKVHVWAKRFFGHWKRYLRTTYPEKISPRAWVDHEIRPPRFLHFLNDPKWILANSSSLEHGNDLILDMKHVLNVVNDLTRQPWMTCQINYA